jgi:hypothetical protein
MAQTADGVDKDKPHVLLERSNAIIFSPSLGHTNTVQYRVSSLLPIFCTAQPEEMMTNDDMTTLLLSVLNQRARLSASIPPRVHFFSQIN